MRAKTAISILRNPAELSLIIRIASFLSVLPLMIRFLKIQTLVERITPGKTHSLGKAMTMERVIYLCERLLRLAQTVGFSFSCLRRSIVLYHFLRAYGVPVVINFGVKWAGDALTGHSWLTLDNTIYLDGSDKVGQFTSVFSLPLEPGEAIERGPGEDVAWSNLGKIRFD